MYCLKENNIVVLGLPCLIKKKKLFCDKSTERIEFLTGFPAYSYELRAVECTNDELWLDPHPQNG